MWEVTGAILLCIALTIFVSAAEVRSAEYACKEYPEMKHVQTRWTKSGCWLQQPDGTWFNYKFKELPK